MKYIKTYESNPKFKLNQWIRRKRDKKVGKIIRRSSTYGGGMLYSVSFINPEITDRINYMVDDLENLTPEEQDFYINTEKYNL